MICGPVPAGFNHDERVLCVLPGIDLLERRAVRRSRSAYGGPGIRVMKGLSFRFRVGTGQSENFDELRHIDSGKLMLTNKRLVFLGDRRTNSVELGDLIGVDAFADGIKVHHARNEWVEHYQLSQRLVIPTESGTLAVDGSMIEAAIQMAKLDQEIAALETSWASAGTAKQPRAASPGASSPAPGGRNQTNSHELGVHLSDLDWKRGPLSRLIEIAGDPMETAGDLKKGSVVTCEVTEVKELCEVYWRNYLANDTHPEWVATEKKDAGIDVKIVGSDLTTFIKCSELGRDRDDQRPERFAVGQKVDALVTQFDRRTHKVQVSIKALEVAEEKEAIAQYGSADSGATTNSTATIK